MIVKNYLFVFVLTTFSLFVNAQESKTFILDYCSDPIEEPVSVGFDEKGNYGGAIFFPADMMKHYVGDKLTKIKFIITDEKPENLTVFITNDLNGEFLYTQKVTELPKNGWYDIALNTPYDVNSNAIYIGYLLSSSVSKPIIYDFDKANSIADGNWLYGNGGWLNTANYSYGNLALKAVVEGPNGRYNDLGIQDFTYNAYVDVNKSLQVKGRIRNLGLNALNGFKIDYTVGNSSGSIVVSEETLAPGVISPFTIDIPVVLNSGSKKEHFEITVLPTDIEDVDLTNNKAEGNCLIYTKSFPRKLLLEQFTSQYCPNCPNGHNVIEKAITNHKDQIVWLTHHSGYTLDAFTTKESKALANFFGVGGAPYVMLDRKVQNTYGSDLPLVMNTGYLSEEMIVQNLETPALVSLKMDSKYDAQTRKVSVTVSGERTGDLMGDITLLTVALVEDGYKKLQWGPNGTQYPEYEHNNFPRVFLTKFNGNTIEFDANNRYEATFSYELPEKMTGLGMGENVTIVHPENIDVIAFVSNQNIRNKNDRNVYNAERIKMIATDVSVTAPQAANMNQVYVVDREIRIDGDYSYAELYDLTGKMMQNQNAGQPGFSTNELKPGVYLVKVLSSVGTRTYKVLISK